jgi:bifunctional DNA-binding transcriptional regulator/antitoxin component of YhaV-PrlF toxin-antitoxin module
MNTLQSKINTRRQTSVPAHVLDHLGAGPGSVLAWELRDGMIIVRRAEKYSSADVHAALFGSEKHTPAAGVDVKAGVRKCVRNRRAARSP